MMRNISCFTLLALVGCGGPGLFSIEAKDSTPAEIAAAVQSRAPALQSETQLAVLAVAGEKPEIIAYDVAGKRELWRVAGEVTSRIEIAGNVVVHGSTGNLTARSVSNGNVLWTLPLADTLLGVATDGRYVAWVAVRGKSHFLNVVEADTGRLAWAKKTEARIGAPAVAGGQVYLPLLSQWILVLDGATGKRLARVRGVDHVISFVSGGRGRHVTFGSKAGVYAFDERASEARADSDVFTSAKIPHDFGESQYDFDAYDPTQAGYSAYDRNNRLLWFPGFSNRNLQLAANMAVVHSYRYLFGFRADSGELAWAYSHPRNDLVASYHTGAVIGLVSSAGEIAAIDPKVGMLRFLERVRVNGRVVGASFAAIGWSPTETVTEIQTPKTVASLTSIAQDRDARFARIKKFAVNHLAGYEGQDAVSELVNVLMTSDDRPGVFNSAAGALVQRRDPSGVPAITRVLDQHYDHVAGKEPKAIAVLARALAAIDASRVAPQARDQATAALVKQLEDPGTDATALFDLVDALAVVGSGEEGPALRRFVLFYRADAKAVAETKAIERALAYLAKRSSADRALVRFVATDARTQPQLAVTARQALGGAPVSR